MGAGGGGGGHAPSCLAGDMGERCKLPHRGLGLRPRSFAVRATSIFKTIQNLISFM